MSRESLRSMRKALELCEVVCDWAEDRGVLVWFVPERGGLVCRSIATFEAVSSAFGFGRLFGDGYRTDALGGVLVLDFDEPWVVDDSVTEAERRAGRARIADMA